jgi:hypothetical protein
MPSTHMVAASHDTEHVVSSAVLFGSRWYRASNGASESVLMLNTRLVSIRLAVSDAANISGPKHFASSMFCGHLQRRDFVLHRYAPLWTRRNHRVHTSGANVGC